MPAQFVPTPDSIPADLELGRQLARHLSRVAPANAAVMQALVADLLADDQAFLAPVRDLTSRAAFLSMLPRIGAGAGQLERDALLTSLAPTYSPAVLARLALVLDGLLNLAAAPPERLPPVPPAAPSMPLPPSVLTPASVLSPEREALPPQGRFLRRLALVAIAGVTAGLTAGTVLVLRSGVLCSLSSGLPFCAASTADRDGQGSGSSPDQAISTGLQAARDLATAADLPSFQRSLEQLETSLLPLESASLSPALLPQRQGLEAIVRTARERLRQEQSDRQGLDLAREALDQAMKQSNPKTIAAVDAAISRLQAISSGSFSEADARTLLRDLDTARLRLQQSVTATPPTTPPAIDGGSPAAPPTANGEAGGASPGRDGSRGQRGEPLF